MKNKKTKKSILSEKEWKKIFEIREKNEKRGVYGKKIIKDKSELKSLSKEEVVNNETKNIY